LTRRRAVLAPGSTGNARRYPQVVPSRTSHSQAAAGATEWKRGRRCLRLPTRWSSDIYVHAVCCACSGPVVARKASSLRCGDSVWKLREFCRAVNVAACVNLTHLCHSSNVPRESAFHPDTTPRSRTKIRRRWCCVPIYFAARTGRGNGGALRHQLTSPQ
jgi:hypothetical protein